MPFRSKAQARLFFAQHPRLAKKWAEETPDMAALPDKKKKNESTGGVKISRGMLSRIVLEELMRLREADDEEADDEPAAPKLGDSSKEKPGKPADDTKSPKTMPAQDKKPKSQMPPKKGAKADDAASPEEVPDEPDPADDDIEKSDGEDDAGAGEINDELAGKTIQSVSQEPKSKLVAGAQEIVLTFNETTEPLRIIVTRTGTVRFFYRGALHNLV